MRHRGIAASLCDLFSLGHNIEGGQRAPCESAIFQKQPWGTQGRCRGVSGRLKLERILRLLVDTLHREAINQIWCRERDYGRDSSHAPPRSRQGWLYVGKAIKQKKPRVHADQRMKGLHLTVLKKDCFLLDNVMASKSSHFHRQERFQ